MNSYSVFFPIDIDLINKQQQKKAAHLVKIYLYTCTTFALIRESKENSVNLEDSPLTEHIELIWKETLERITSKFFIL